MVPKVVTPDAGRVYDVLGTHIRVVVTGDDTEGRFGVVEQRDLPGVGIPPHVHSHEDETFHVVSGAVRFTVGAEEVVAEAGTTVLAPRGVPHAYETVGDGEAVMLITFVPAGLERMFIELSELPAGPPDMDQVLAVCRRAGIEFLAAEQSG